MRGTVWREEEVKAQPGVRTGGVGGVSAALHEERGERMPPSARGLGKRGRRGARESWTGPVTCLRREEAGVSDAAAGKDFNAIQKFAQSDRNRRERVDLS